jgi:HSP20 family protein
MEVLLMFGLVPYIRRNTGLTKRGDIWGIDRLFDDFFNDSFFGRWVNTPVRADIRETENEWLIDAELPGVDKNDIQIDLNDGLLTISVEQKKEVNEENENYIRRERAYGNYKRSFYVEDVKEEDIKAVGNFVIVYRNRKNHTPIVTIRYLRTLLRNS